MMLDVSRPFYVIAGRGLMRMILFLGWCVSIYWYILDLDGLMCLFYTLMRYSNCCIDLHFPRCVCWLYTCIWTLRFSLAAAVNSELIWEVSFGLKKWVMACIILFLNLIIRMVFLVTNDRILYRSCPCGLCDCVFPYLFIF